ncbi:MAG: hypothetical protein JW806_05315 [Sedimentisphaerales bacterium]|nr:hypothetical protein [Sedimentisphaerales bacterium]
MGRVWAVARNTFISSMRMKTAIVFILLLMILLPVLYLTTTGDGTAIGRIQSFISYGLGLTAFLISILTIIVSCYTLSSDIKHKQIYTVVTKPVKRFELIIGKILGVVLLDLLLLVVFSSAIYACTLYMPRLSKVADTDIKRLDDEFYTARASLKVDFDELAIEKIVFDEYEELVKTGRLDKSRSREDILDELRKTEKYSRNSAEPGGQVIWEFQNIKPFDVNESIFVRFKYNASQMATGDIAYGNWYVGDYRQIKYGQGWTETPIYNVPRKDTCGSQHEFEVPADAVAKDGYLAVVFYNEPRNATTVMFSPEDGFEVLYKAGSFRNNFLRAQVVIFVRLVFLAVLGVSLSVWLGFPVAILCSLTIFFMGMINGFVVGSFGYLGQNMIVFYKYVMKPLIWLLPRFDGNYNINGYIIDAKLISNRFLVFAIGALVIKSLVLMLAGFLIFTKREIAKVII